jgi:hypothetical protein
VSARAVGMVALLLAGCWRADSASEADYLVLCALDGRAFYMRPAAGDTTFVRRVPTADQLCAPRDRP